MPNKLSEISLLAFAEMMNMNFGTYRDTEYFREQVFKKSASRFSGVAKAKREKRKRRNIRLHK